MPETGSHPAPPQRRGLDSRRVGIDVRYLQRRGVGISRYVRQVVDELTAAGADLTLITDRPDHRDALRSAYPDAAAVALPGRSGFLWEQRQLARHLERARYDVYIAPANFGLPFSYRGPTELVLVVHALIPLRLGHIYLLRQPLWAIKYLLSTGVAVPGADRVVAPSEATARDAARLLRTRNVSVVYPAFPVPLAGDQEQVPGPLPAVPPGAPERYFLYNGGADIRKNVPAMLRAFALVRDELPETQLVMIGNGMDYFRKLIGRLRLQDRVQLCGYVDELEKERLLTHAVALLYPSRMEGFGLPVLEAMAAGIPVVSGTGGSLAEIGGNFPIYVRPTNDKAIARAMVAASQDDIRGRARTEGMQQLTLLMGRREKETFADVVAAVASKR